jgi:signal transduction histidine kinase
VRLNRLLRTAAFQFLALYAVVFGISVLALSVIVYWITQAALDRQFNARIESEAAVLAAQYRSNDLDRFESLLRERESPRKQRQFHYRLTGADQLPLEDTLNLSPPPSPGWSDRTRNDGAAGGPQEFRVLTIALDHGLSLSVGRDLSSIRDVGHAILVAFAWAFAATIVLGLLGGLFVSRRFLARVDSMTSAGQEIIDGNLKHRLPLHKTNDDLDFLALTLNRMLDRINELMESVRQVSSDIAHDLRTPLSRLRHRLEAALAAERTAAELSEAIAGAINETDGILSIFSALLRIAQIEAGTRRSAFACMDLSSLVNDLADAFAPSIQDEGKSLKIFIEPNISTIGDKELLTQLLANLLENAIHHTPAGTTIEMQLRSLPGRIQFVLADNGPGVPLEARDRLFDSFYRPEKSRTTPGSGLGLSLVKAVANLHNATVVLGDNKPGLRVELAFQNASAQAY